MVARQALRTAGFVTVTGAMLPAFLAAMAATPAAARDAARDAWVRRWARALLRLFAIEVVVDRDTHAHADVDADADARPTSASGARVGRLVVSNHRSAIDIGVLLATFGGTMVSRADLAGWPVVGAAARAVGTVFVDRTSAKSGAATIRAIQRRLESGQTIALFPEGTTFEGDEVRPFHRGAFVAATRAGAEILPVGLAYPKTSGAAFVNETFPRHLARLAASGATRMVAAVAEPFAAERGTSARATSDRAHRAVVDAVARARSLCGP